jgi:hypothetical protein
MTIALSTQARQALVALMLHVTEASNPDLQELYRVTIRKGARDELDRNELIIHRKGTHNAIFHELTDRGWVRARQELTLAPLAGVGPAWRLLYSTFRHLDGLMIENGYKIADVFNREDLGPIAEPSIEARIRRAYDALADQPGDLVSLAALRAKIPNISRSDLDDVLLEMDRRREIQLDPDPDRRVLTDAAKAAAITLGGEDKHLITIGPS